MLRTGVDLQLPELRAPEPVARQHSLHGLPQHLGGPPLELFAQRPAAQAAGIARVPVVHLVVELLARDRDLLGVDDDDEVAGVDVRGVLRLVLAAQRVGDARRETPEGLPLRVNEAPLALDLAGFCVPGLHKSGGPGVRRGTSVANPARKSAAPPWEGWRTPGAPNTDSASRPTAIARRPATSSSRNGRHASISARVGRRFDVSVPGWVGTTFQSKTCSSSPSSARTRCTIVAVASAGPLPVSWRSEVKGRPETLAPR